MIHNFTKKSACNVRLASFELLTAIKTASHLFITLLEKKSNCLYCRCLRCQI